MANGPVVHNKDEGYIKLILAIIAAVTICVVAFVYFWPARETEAERLERRRAQIEAGGKPGSPGVPLGKPRGEDVPRLPPPPELPPLDAQAKPGAAEKEAARLPPRPRPSAMPILAAKAPTPPPAVQRDDDKPAKPAKLGGMLVMEAERIDDISWYLMPGEKIMCRNNEELTEKEGANWTAIIPEEKRSRDGTRVLIPANSMAFGTTVSGFQNGDRRLGAMITHIIGNSVPGRPTLFIPIDNGQVGNDLGSVDLDGNVQNNFLERLGTVGAYALLDAVARGGTSYASGTLNRAINGNSDGVNVNVGNFGGMGTGSSLGGMAMQEQLRRRPSFSRPAPHDCTIMITKPIDLRKALQFGK